MANVIVKIPLSNAPVTFATRSRRRAGLGGLFGKRAATPTLTRVGGPIVCPRGLQSFFTRKLMVPLPAASVFGPFSMSGRGLGVFSHSRAFPRRGMGQDEDLGASYTPAFEDALAASGGAAPTFSVASDLPTETTLSSITAPSNIVTLPASEGGGTVNLSEVQAALATPTLSPVQTLLGAGYTAAQIAALTPAQQTAAAQAVPSSVGSTLTSFVNQYGVYLVIGGLGLFALSAISKKGKR